MSIFKELFNEPLILLFRHLKFLSFTRNYPGMFVVQILLNIFETLVPINQLVCFDQPILPLLVILQLFSVIVALLLMLPERELLLLGDVRFHVVFCAVKAGLGFYDCDVLLLKLFCLELLLPMKFVRNRLYFFSRF